MSCRIDTLLNPVKSSVDFLPSSYHPESVLDEEKIAERKASMQQTMKERDVKINQLYQQALKNFEANPRSFETCNKLANAKVNLAIHHLFKASLEEEGKDQAEVKLAKTYCKEAEELNYFSAAVHYGKYSIQLYERISFAPEQISSAILKLRRALAIDPKNHTLQASLDLVQFRAQQRWKELSQGGKISKECFDSYIQQFNRATSQNPFLGENIPINQILETPIEFRKEYFPHLASNNSYLTVAEKNGTILVSKTQAEKANYAFSQASNGQNKSNILVIPDELYNQIMASPLVLEKLKQTASHKN